MKNRQRSKTTIRKYLKDAARLVTEFQKENQSRGVKLREWLIEKAGTVRKSTWGGYRAALIEWGRQGKGIGGYEPQEVVTIVESVGRNYAAGGGEKTSRQKYKLLPPDLFSKLMNYMAVSRSKYDGIISDWLVAGALTGLRPVEWESATILKKTDDEGTTYLIVTKNAKRSNGRSFSDDRGIILKNPDENAMNAVRNMISLAKRTNEEGKSWMSVYTRCRHRLLQINHIVSPRRKKHVTLYSPRHQFAADLKANGFSREEQAALMGHGSTATATIHYARKNHGRKLPHTVMARKKDVEAVRRWNANKKDMRAKMEAFLKEKQETGARHGKA